MMWGYYSNGWMMLFGMLLQGMFWIALIGLAIWLFSRWFASRAPSTGTPPAGPSAMEILRQRYARGEIDAATFDAMASRLQAPTSAVGDVRPREPTTA